MNTFNLLFMNTCNKLCISYREINYLQWKLVINQNIMDTQNRFLLSNVLLIRVCTLHGRPYSKLNEVPRSGLLCKQQFVYRVLSNIAMRADEY